MTLSDTKNPIDVDCLPVDEYQGNNNRILMAIDRGNGSSKSVVSLNSQVIQPFKIPSVVRKVSDDNAPILINKQGYVCGDKAISMTAGTSSTPLTTGDKVKELCVVVAQVIGKISEDYTLTNDLDLSLVVSSPFPSETLVKEIKTELKQLSKKFRTLGKTYRVVTNTVRVESEGSVLLKSAFEFNGVIDIGYGTILAAYRNELNQVINTPLMGGDMGGCNLVINALLKDAAFIAKVKSTGVSALPSPERLNARFSDGVTTLKGFDVLPMLKPHLKILKGRIEDAAASVQASLRLSSEEIVKPRIALVGGGACLLKLALTPEQIQTWGEKHHIEIFDQPDYQTALVMHQNAHIEGL